MSNFQKLIEFLDKSDIISPDESREYISSWHYTFLDDPEENFIEFSYESDDGLYEYYLTEEDVKDGHFSGSTFICDQATIKFYKLAGVV